MKTYQLAPVLISNVVVAYCVLVGQSMPILMNKMAEELKFKMFLRDSMNVQCYADALFSSNEDSATQIGYIVLIADNNGDCHILEYQSRNSRELLGLAWAAEVYAFEEAYNSAFLIVDDVKKTLKMELDLHMYTDSLQFFDAFTRD